MAARGRTLSPVPNRSSATVQGKGQSRYALGPNAYAGYPPTQSQSRAGYTMRSSSADVDTEEDDDDIYPKRSNSSAVIIHRPPFTEPHQRVTARVKPKGGKHPLFYFGLVLCAVVEGFVAAAYFPPLFQKWNNDRVYGYPRTYQIDAIVGHSDPKNPTSHFIALNDKGNIEVVEIPNGDRSKFKPQLYVIAQLTNQGADLVPVTISFSDMNGDGKPDLVVEYNNSIWIWYNDGSTFKPTL